MFVSASTSRKFASKIGPGKLDLPGALDLRLRDDIRRFGIDALKLEVIEVLEVKAEMCPDDIARDLAVLVSLWRERHDPSLLY